MIKKLQALRAKKGFTLVELIVVIAIIGVLAAILVPTMLGQVTNSRVTSANSTAASIKNTVNNFIVSMDTRGYTFDRSSAHTCTITMASGDTTVGVEFSEGAFKGDAADQIESIQTTLGKQLFDDFGFSKVWAIVYIENGKPVGCAYSSDAAEPATAFELENFKSPNAFEGWDDGAADGIMDGLIYGTSPVLTAPLGSE